MNIKIMIRVLSSSQIYLTKSLSQNTYMHMYTKQKQYIESTYKILRYERFSGLAYQITRLEIQWPIYIYIYVFSSRLFWMHTHARKKNIIPEAREWIIISPGFWLIQRYKSTRKTISLLNLYTCVPVDYLDEIDGMYFNGFSKKNQIIFIS